MDGLAGRVTGAGVGAGVLRRVAEQVDAGQEAGEPRVGLLGRRHELVPPLVRAGAVEREDDELRRLVARCQLGHRDVRRRTFAGRRRQRFGRVVVVSPRDPTSSVRTRDGRGDRRPTPSPCLRLVALIDQHPGDRGQDHDQSDDQVTARIHSSFRLSTRRRRRAGGCDR